MELKNESVDCGPLFQTKLKTFLTVGKFLNIFVTEYVLNIFTISNIWYSIFNIQVQFEGEQIYLQNSILDINKQVSYFVMNGLYLPDAVYTINVVAINSMYIRSSRVTSNVTVQSSVPTLVGMYKKCF